MKIIEDGLPLVTQDPRFTKALNLFNSADWYPAHDIFEELWHETNPPERTTLQGILQIAVAQLHLERGNSNGAIILYGEGIGRLRNIGTPDLGLDINKLCQIVEKRLSSLHEKSNLENCELPFLLRV